MSGQLHASASLPQENSPLYSLEMRFGGPQSRSGGGGEEKIPDLDENRTIVQPIAKSL
jgi:hypothetical protein